MIRRTHIPNRKLQTSNLLSIIFLTTFVEINFKIRTPLFILIINQWCNHQSTSSWLKLILPSCVDLKNFRSFFLNSSVQLFPLGNFVRFVCSTVCLENPRSFFDFVAMGSRKEEERNERIIRGLMKLPPNRRCINCNGLVNGNFFSFLFLAVVENDFSSILFVSVNSGLSFAFLSTFQLEIHDYINKLVNFEFGTVLDALSTPIYV